jgi:hypothetical protein
MGANLSSKVITHVDTSADIISPGEHANELRLAIFWISCFYVIAMIWSTTLLVDRWRGPHGDNRNVGFTSVLAAILLSAAWPVVFVYLMMSG